MNAMTMNQKIFTPVPPDKGSFPLDHEGKCKREMLYYMKCISESEGDSGICRDFAKSYLGCRMDNHLMAKEDWGKLGFKNENTSKES